MSEAFREDLVAKLEPVRKLGSPWLQVLTWVAIVAAATVVLAAFADLPLVIHRLMIVPDMWVAELGAFLTACLAASAAFQLSRPDRSPGWLALPLPGLALWVGASSVGSARLWPPPAVTHAVMMDGAAYVGWVFGFSVPLSAATLWLLRRGYTLYPNATAAMGGLAVAATAAATMVLFHPAEASLIDLVVHGCAVLVVVAANRALSDRIFGRERSRRGARR